MTFFFDLPAGKKGAKVAAAAQPENSFSGP